MPSIERGIVTNVIALLDAVGRPVGMSVHGDENIPLEKDQLPAVVVYPNTEAIERLDHMQLGRTLRLFVELRIVTGGASESIDDALDVLYVWVSSQMQSDRTLGGLVMNVLETRRGWDREQADTGHGLMLVEFDVEYVTSRTDPTTK